MEKNDKRGAVEELGNKIIRMKKLSSMMSSVKGVVEEWEVDENKEKTTKEITDYYKNMLYSLKEFSVNLNELVRHYEYQFDYMRSMTAIYAPPDVFRTKKNQDDESNNQDDENSD